MSKGTITSENLPPVVGPYSPAVLVENVKDMLFISGQLPFDKNGNLPGNGTIAECTKQIFDNTAELLKEAGMDFNNVIKTSCFLTDMNDFTEMNNVYATYFSDECYPARETVQVAALPKNVHVEISFIAVKTK